MRECNCAGCIHHGVYHGNVAHTVSAILDRFTVSVDDNLLYRICLPRLHRQLGLKLELLHKSDLEQEFVFTIWQLNKTVQIDSILKVLCRLSL